MKHTDTDIDRHTHTHTHEGEGDHLRIGNHQEVGQAPNLSITRFLREMGHRKKI